MPIYAYKCASCGHAADVLQKISAAPLTECPACGMSTYSKQVTAAGFQLKGGGWYVTDFKGGNAAAPAAKTESASDKSADKTTETKTDSAPAASSAPATSAPATAAAPAAAASASAAT
jgi:putative FmdB family regulatory protein